MSSSHKKSPVDRPTNSLWWKTAVEQPSFEPGVKGFRSDKSHTHKLQHKLQNTFVISVSVGGKICAKNETKINNTSHVHVSKA